MSLNHCVTAQQLLWQSTAWDVAIIAEPYRVPSDDGNWTADRAETQETAERLYKGSMITKANGVIITVTLLRCDMVNASSHQKRLQCLYYGAGSGVTD